MMHIGNIALNIGATASNESTAVPFTIPEGIEEIRIFSSDAAATYQYLTKPKKGFQVNPATHVPVDVAAGATNWQTIRVNKDARNLVLSVRNTGAANTTIRVYAPLKKAPEGGAP